MSETDSFIHEVSEEVRRDRLFAFFRRWGWLFGLVVILLVGSAAFFEYRRATERAAAEAFGDALIQALDSAEDTDRRAALEAIEPASPEAEMLLALLLAGQEADAGEAAAAAERLRAVGNRTDMPQRYRDLALLKAHLLVPEGASEAMALLDRLAQPGAPYRALAIEQQAYLMIESGDRDGGLALLQELLDEAGTTQSLQQRVRQLIVAVETGAALSDTPLPEPEPEPAEAAEDDEAAAPEEPDTDDAAAEEGDAGASE